MITIEHQDRLVTAAIFGAFELADFQRFEAEVLHTIEACGQVDLLVDLRTMLSYTLDVAWEEVRFVRAHARDFRRVAVIARDEFSVWIGWLARLLSEAEVRVFDAEDDARTWLAEPYPQPTALDTMDYRLLISVADLARHLNAPGLVVFDCRHDLLDKGVGTAAYARGHLPDARFAHVDHDLAGPLTGRNGRHPLPDPAVFTDWLGRMGVTPSTQVVGYDASGGTYASRLWWMLRHWLGHEKVAVLDGGWDAWVKTGHPVATALPEVRPTRYTAQARDGALVTVDQVVAHLGDASVCIIDARAADRFRGQNETIDPVGGHIPGAVNRFFRDNLDAMGFFRPPAELKAAFAPLVGERRGRQVVQQCGSGVSACHNLLAMAVAGMDPGVLYPGSWSEWCADPARPVAT